MNTRTAPVARGKRGGSVRLTRAGAILHVQRQLQAHSWPRVQMGLIVALTGAAGLFCSFLLLQVGVLSMSVRYPLALLGAYGVFLLLLWAWLRTQGPDLSDAAVELADGVLSNTGGGGGSSSSGGSFDWKPGGGGNFGGGGASSAFEAPAASMGAAESGSSASLSSDLGEAVSDVFSGDDLIVPLLVVLMALGLALASLYVVYSAPALLAELLFDGTLSYTLYRHLRRGEEPNWLLTAVRKTALPFALTAIFLMGVGAALGHFAPGAHTVGEALHRAL